MKIFGYEITRQKPNLPALQQSKAVVNIPKTRVSEPDIYEPTSILITPEGKRLAPAPFNFALIPIIRLLAYTNPDMSQALKTIVQLTNTGFKLTFKGIEDPKEIEQIREHIELASRKWFDGCSGIDGFLNKVIAQIYISGALSAEWVVNNKLTGIDNVVLVKPETIRFMYEKGRYIPYQQLRHSIGDGGYRKLNPNSFRYYALDGDTENPHGIPPYLAALDSLEIQQVMVRSINFLVKQMGLVGFLEALTEKPDQLPGENDIAYYARLELYLETFKTRLGLGFSDGIMAGYKSDHEFNFHSTTKSANNVDKLFESNEHQVASGLKIDPSFLGRTYGRASEAQITILFTKMLSEIKNIQIVFGPWLEELLYLETQLAGFNKCTAVFAEFKQSTLTDELKYQQGQEIKIRNLMNLYNYGIISLADFSDNLDRGQPDQKEPRIPLADPSQDTSVKSQIREKQKDKSDRKVREKNKPQ